MSAVEWKPLKEIVESISTGLNPRQNFVLNDDNASLYYVTVKEISSNKIIFSENTDKISREAKNIINKRSKLELGDILFSGIGTIGKVVYVDIPTSNWDCSESVFLLKPSENVVSGKYLTYILLSDIAKKQYEIGANGAIMKGVRKNTLENILIPIPSLAKQQEIVSHLDTFTTLISSLESELDMRRKQYEHYRNQLFGDTLDLLLEKADKGEIKVSTLSKVGTFTRGRRFVRTDIMTEGTPCIHYGDMYTYYGVSAKITPTFLLPEVAVKLRFAQENDVVIVGAGENNEDIGIGVAWLGKEDVAVHDACYVFKHQMNPLYVSYYLRTDIYHKQIKKHVSSGKICSISSDGIGKSIIPIPSLNIQQEIVSKLDAFENLIQSLEQEIKLRKQQYEYYREKLLTFE